MAQRLYRLLLLACPGTLRRRHGAEMTAAFAAELAAARRRGEGLSYWLFALHDLLGTAARSRGRQLGIGRARRRRATASAPDAGRGATGLPGPRLDFPFPRHVSPTLLESSMDILRNDLRYSLRSLGRTPGFTAVVLVTLALGIGANTAIFSIVDGVLLQPLPYPEPERLVRVGWQWNRGEGTDVGFSALKAGYWLENARGFAALTTYDTADFDLSGDGVPEPVDGLRVEADFFRVLGTGPVRGRGFQGVEDLPGGPRVAILGDSLWRRRFAGDEEVLGQRIVLDGYDHTVVGILPPGFSFQGVVDVVVPLQLAAQRADPNHAYYLLGRLRDGVDLEAARAEMQELLVGFARDVPGGGVDPESNGIHAAGLHEVMVGDVADSLWVLLGAVGFVLLIACANVANLMLGRAAGRDREMAIRGALGASRGRVIRQLLVESLVLATAGGALGLLLASWSLGSFLALVPAATPRLEEISLDGSVLLFTALASLATGVVFGMGSALKLSGPDLATTLKSGGRNPAERRARPLLRKGLVVAEVALSLVLLVGAGILVASFLNVRGVDPGFEPRGVVALEIRLAAGRHPTPEAGAELARRVLERLRAVPAVEAAGAVSSVPLERGLNTMAGVAGGSFDDRIFIEYRPVSPGYFAALGVPVLAGRDFTDADVGGALPVAIVNRAFATAYWNDEDPLGRTIVPGMAMGSLEGPARQIVGLVGDVRERGLDDAAPPTVFVPHAQVPPAVYELASRSFPLAFLVRAPLSDELAAELRGAVAAVDPSQAVREIRSLEQVIADATHTPRFWGLLTGSFAALALVLTAVGLYGVISSSVAQRRQEIGLRMALGAEAGRVLRMVLGEGMLLTVTGVILGLAGAWFLAGVLESMVFEISPLEPRIHAGVAVLLLMVAALACVVPACRAVRVDPVVALEAE